LYSFKIRCNEILTLFWLRRVGGRIEAAVIGGIKALCKLIWTVVPTTDQVGKTILIRIAIPLKKQSSPILFVRMYLICKFNF
jgi:hypothetical protein